MGKPFVFAALGIVALTGLLTVSGCGQQAASGTIERVVLSNGLTVVLAPVKVTGKVAVESFYRAGLANEPKGMPQVSHLVEHLVCQCATRSYKAYETMGLLNEKGMAGAETLPCSTHYDYVVPADDLELALRIEAERLSSLKITPDVVQQEIPKCYQEARTVEQRPQAGMLKFAFAALNQAWRHRLTAANVKSGLEKTGLDEIRRYHQSFYQPRNAVLVLVGDFDRKKAMGMVKKHLGSLKAGEGAPPKPIQWDEIPKKLEVRWDSSVSAVCIAFRPPDDANDRALANLWGRLLRQKLMTDEQISRLSDHVSCADPIWNLDELPFFIYATPKPGVSLSELQAALDSVLREALSRPEARDEMAQLLYLADQAAETSVPSPEMLRSAIQQSSSQGIDREMAEGLIMGNFAIQIGCDEMLTGGKPDQLAALKGKTPEELLSRLRRALDPSRKCVTLLLPIQPDTPG